jgi:hypothetical protein
MDVTSANETPYERAAFGETLRVAQQRDQFSRHRKVTPPWERATSAPPELQPALEALRKTFDGDPYAAARSMVAVVLRKRQEREERTQRRELVAYLVLGALLAVSVAGAVLASQPAAGLAVTASVAVAGMLLGLTLRSWL